MKIKILYTLTFSIFIMFSCNRNAPKVTLNEDPNNKNVEVMVNGKLFTVYNWRDDIFKPVLYPVYTSAGTEITRGYPINQRDGERSDHPHQIGIMLNYRDVNGYNFWGNGSQGLGIRNEDGGIIKHVSVKNISEGKGKGSMKTVESWVDPYGKELLKEDSEYHFIAKDNIRIIDRITTLTATDEDVSMNDKKDGLFAIRVARELEIPDQGTVTFDTETVQGNTDNIVTGNYLSSEGQTGLDVWGTRARWMDLFGIIGDEKISIVMCDHPKNPYYPTYWHARGYGLLAANPLGWSDFTNNEKQLNFNIPAGESVTFRYRVIISSGKYLKPEIINEYADEFATKY